LWKKNYDGSIEHWIELGLPDERRIRQICAKANKVTIYTYHGNQAIQWYNSVENMVKRFSHLDVIYLSIEEGKFIESLVVKGMDFSISIEDNQLWIANDHERICVEFALANGR
jgi:uncharacterized protein YaeQ